MSRTRAEWNPYYPDVLLQTSRCGSLLFVAIVVAVVLGHVFLLWLQFLLWLVWLLLQVWLLLPLLAFVICLFCLQLRSEAFCSPFELRLKPHGREILFSQPWATSWPMTSANWSAAQNQKMLSECFGNWNIWDFYLTVQFMVHIDISLHGTSWYFVLFVLLLTAVFCCRVVGFLGQGGKLQFGSLDGDLGHHRHIFQPRISGAAQWRNSIPDSRFFGSFCFF